LWQNLKSLTMVNQQEHFFEVTHVPEYSLFNTFGKTRDEKNCLDNATICRKLPSSLRNKYKLICKK